MDRDKFGIPSRCHIRHPSCVIGPCQLLPGSFSHSPIYHIAIYPYAHHHPKVMLSVGVALGLLLIDNMGLWDLSMETLSLVLVAAGTAVLLGIPLGILSARNAKVESVVKVFLDIMQTMPSFVYLIPVVIFFGLGNVPGMIATVVFAIPPVVRLTSLGIRQVPRELNEVADSFGTSRLQKLFYVQLPVAMPSIRTGINQCIMLSLSMVVIASMIGARGLGYNVLVAIQRIDIGMGFEAGLAIVILAIILTEYHRISGKGIIKLTGQSGQTGKECII